MPEYVCPNCRGGFPGLSERFVDDGDTERQCPWCGQALDGSHEPQPDVAVTRESRVEDRKKWAEVDGGPDIPASDDKDEGLLGRLFG